MAATAAPAWAGGATTAAPPKVAAGHEQSRVVVKPTLTAAQLASTATKDAEVARVMAGTSGSSRTAAAAALPMHKSIKAVRQQAQVRSYWCGPATLAMLVQASDVHISQTTAAKRLKTTSNGTNWYSGSGNYPMERALQHYTKGFDFTPANLGNLPTKTDKNRFKARLVTNVATHKQGIAGNAVEVTNGPHLNGHPNRTIYHWVAVRGYDDNGATARYADSVSGSGISWSTPVQRYNEISSDKIVTIFGARGYIW